jgi:hypothetical protein
MRLKQIVLVILLASCSRVSDTGSHGSGEPRMNAAGGTAGIPQLAGVQYERLLGPSLALDLHAGTAILFNSFGARMSLGSTSDGFGPRLSMGLVSATMSGPWQEDPGDMETLLFSWPGAGIVLRTAGLTAALDLGWLFATSHETGWAANSYPAASISVMGRF